MACGRLPEAATCYQRAYEENPADADALLLLGIVASQVKHFPAAIPFTQLAIAHRPQAAHLHLNLALAYLAAQDLEQARTSCRHALELDPANERSWCALGEIEIAREDQRCRVAAYEQGMSLSSAKGRAAESWAICSAHSNRMRPASRPMLRAFNRPRRNALFTLAMGAAKFALGDVQEAKAAYRKALSLKPNFPEAYLNLGNALYHEGNFQSAVVSYRCAINLRPNYVKAYCNLGNALWALGRHQGGGRILRACARARVRFLRGSSQPRQRVAAPARLSAAPRNASVRFCSRRHRISGAP